MRSSMVSVREGGCARGRAYRRHSGGKAHVGVDSAVSPAWRSTKVTVDFVRYDRTSLQISTECKVTGQTGVEMEALTAASVAALTVYDMCKSADREMTIETVRLRAQERRQRAARGIWLDRGR